MRGRFVLRLVARQCVRLLHRIMQRASLLLGSLFKVVVGDLKVVLRRYGLGISDPRADNVQRVFFSQFRFTRAAEVLKQLGPWFQAGATDNPVQLRPKVGI